MMYPKPKKTRRKPEPVTKIQMQEKKECWVTGQTTGLHRHHIYGGARRKLSEKYGLYVYLIPGYHNTTSLGVHFNSILDRELKMVGQWKFEKVYSRQLFVKLFGKNYL